MDNTQDITKDLDIQIRYYCPYMQKDGFAGISDFDFRYANAVSAKWDHINRPPTRTSRFAKLFSETRQWRDTTPIATQFALENQERSNFSEDPFTMPNTTIQRPILTYFSQSRNINFSRQNDRAARAAVNRVIQQEIAAGIYPYMDTAGLSQYYWRFYMSTDSPSMWHHEDPEFGLRILNEDARRLLPVLDDDEELVE